MGCSPSRKHNQALHPVTVRVVAPANEPQCTVTPPTVAQQSPPTPTPKGHERRISSANLEAVSEVRQLLSRMTESEEYPTSDELEATLLHLLHVLSPERDGSDSLSANSASTPSELEDVKEREVRAWLQTTFTKRDSAYREPSPSGYNKFKWAATFVRYGKYMNKLYQEVSLHSHGPVEVFAYLKGNLDNWEFDVFHFEQLAGGTPLRYLGFELFKRHNLIKKFEIQSTSLDAFLVAMENGYRHHDNPYHNSTHATDVVQTLHYFLTRMGTYEWFTQQELLAAMLAAIVHDVEHTGTTNNFHVQSGSELALLYNDRSVLENHHVYFAYKHLTQEGMDILKNLSQEDYRSVRSLVINMVLATDMSCHFEQVLGMKTTLNHPEGSLDRNKVLSMMLHCADISHPAKPWSLHDMWTYRLVSEFFRQGDMEKELGRQCSPLCDRNTTLVPESQIGFIDFIVSPTFDTFVDLVEVLQASCDKSCDSGSEAPSVVEPWPWLSNFQENKARWKELCSSSKGANEDNPGDQNGRRKTVETRHKKNVVEKRKLSRVEVVKDGGAKVVETCEEHTREEQEEHSKVEKL